MPEDTVGRGVVGSEVVRRVGEEMEEEGREGRWWEGMAWLGQQDGGVGFPVS